MSINTKYQIVILGEEHPLKNEIIRLFNLHVTELGMNSDLISFLSASNFYNNYESKAPTVALYFGNAKKDFPDIDILEQLIKNGTYILPIVDDLQNYEKKVPKQLIEINGKNISESELEPIVSCILEALSLLRVSRRIFISYKRSESSTVAIQLYERLEKAGFDVFLDTHSVRPGDNFQDELWHRLVDTDVVVLLNTKGFLESEWTTEEVAKASSMSIGILQLVWPKHKPERMSELSIMLSLKDVDFVGEKYENNSLLEEDCLNLIVSTAEALRARTLGARQDSLITEFITSARALKINTELQPERFITIDKGPDKELIILPTVGVPHAFRYNESEELIKRLRTHKKSEAYLLYDHRNIRLKWLNHLYWLDRFLPLKSIKITEIEKWLKGI